MQEKALQLIGSKLEASIGIEGKFSEEGLIAMSSGDDMMNALAKSIVDKLEPLDSAENIWKRINKKAGLESKIMPTILETDANAGQRIFQVEFIEKRGKRRVIERKEVTTDEIDDIVKTKKCVAQLLLF